MSTTRTIRGETTLYGDMLSMGRDHGTIDVPGTGPLRVEVPAAIVPAMVARVGTVVGVEGMATWDVATMAMVGFRVERLTEYDPGSMTLTEAFDALREASGGAWNDVDVEAFMREMRGD